jgi:hypothetical protein
VCVASVTSIKKILNPLMNKDFAERGFVYVCVCVHIKCPVFKLMSLKVCRCEMPQRNPFEQLVYPLEMKDRNVKQVLLGSGL